MSLVALRTSIPLFEAVPMVQSTLLGPSVLPANDVGAGDHGKTEGPGNMLYTIGTASRSGIEVLSATKLVDAIQATTVRGVENPGGKLEAGGGCVLKAELCIRFFTPRLFPR